MKKTPDAIPTVDRQAPTAPGLSTDRLARPTGKVLLDLGAVSTQTRGGSGFNIEGVDCVIRGHFFCP